MLKNKLYKLLCHFVFPNKGITHVKRNPQLIVSLTSYPKRIGVVHETINSLLKQSLKPDHVVLWLSESQFPSKEKQLPKSLLRLINGGLSIKWCEDLCSYKKLIPSLMCYPNDIIVTADDDVIYRENWLEILYKSNVIYPNDILCHHAFDYKVDKLGNIVGFDIVKKSKVLTKTEMAIGIGGILYPPNSFKHDVVDKQVFCKLAPTNDDFWFWAMAKLNKKNVRLIDDYIDNIVCIENTQNEGLWESTNINGEGSRQFRQIIEQYPQLKDNL